MRQVIVSRKLCVEQAMVKSLQNQRQSLAALTQLLETVSPLRTLQRGYAIVTDQDENIVRDSTALSKGDLIHTRLSSGGIVSEVKALLNGDS